MHVRIMIMKNYLNTQNNLQKQPKLASARSLSMLPGIHYAIKHRQLQEALFFINKATLSDLCSPHRPVLQSACKHDYIPLVTNIIQRARALGGLNKVIGYSGDNGASALALAAKNNSLDSLKLLLSLDDDNLLYCQASDLLHNHERLLSNNVIDALSYHLQFIELLRHENFKQAVKMVYQMHIKQRPWKIIQQHWNKLSPYIHNDAISMKNIDHRKVARSLLQELITYTQLYY